MMVTDIASLCIPLDNSIQEALIKLDTGRLGIVLVVDAELHLVGTITDGDIRRAVLAGVPLDTSVQHILDNKAGGMYAQPVFVRVGATQEECLQLLREYAIRQLPVLDEHDRLAGLLTIDELLPQEPLPLQAVIMAGGYGTRLRPLTEDLPKPLLPVGGRPLMEYIVEQIQQSGIRQVHVSTYFMGEKIKEHFGDGSSYGVNMQYVTEGSPLGTAGALGLVEHPAEPFLVINGDILTQLNFRDMFSFHRKHGADMTVGVRQYTMQVPYGVVQSEGANVRAIQEKPNYSFLVNAGIYLLEPSVLQYIPKDQVFNMTDLIDRLIKSGRPVVSFPILEYWLDIGQHTDYQQAQDDIEKGKLTL